MSCIKNGKSVIRFWAYRSLLVVNCSLTIGKSVSILLEMTVYVFLCKLYLWLFNTKQEKLAYSKGPLLTLRRPIFRNSNMRTLLKKTYSDNMTVDYFEVFKWCIHMVITDVVNNFITLSVKVKAVISFIRRYFIL